MHFEKACLLPPILHLPRPTFLLYSCHMTVEKDFWALYEPWYQSPQGQLALEGALRLTQRTLSPWHRRGHCILQIGFDHVKSLEILWQSGFDVSAVCICSGLLESLEAPVRHCVDIEYRSPQGLDNLPYADKSFDYVVINLPPIQENQQYPPLHSLLGEALRIAGKGILFQGWNPASLVGLRHTWQKKSLPAYLQACPWHAWRDVYTTLRTLHPAQKQAPSSIHTQSALFGPLAWWQEHSRLKKLHGLMMPLPMGALMHIRLNLKDQGAMRGMPLFVNPLVGEELRASPVTERIHHKKSLELSAQATKETITSCHEKNRL